MIFKKNPERERESNSIKKGAVAVFSTAAALVLGGCGGSGGGGATSTVINGTAIDGYIRNATVCLDINSNELCDSSEPTTTTDDNGTFTLDTTHTGTYPILVVGGIDTATNESFEGTLKEIVDANGTTLSPNVTPLTTLSANLYLQEKKSDPNYTVATAKQTIATNLGLSDLSKIETDPMEDTEVFIKSQQLVQNAKVLSELVKSQEDNNASKAFDRIMKNVAQSIKDDTTTGDFNATNIITQIETNSSISIDGNISLFLQTHMDRIKQQIDAKDETTTFASLQSSLHDKIVAAKEKIESEEFTQLDYIWNPNTAPQATFSSFSTNEDTAYNGTLTATDADGDSVTYTKVTDPSNGTLAVEADGSFSYTPDANYNGSDSFTYKVNDGTANSAEKTVSITVNAANDTPTVSSQTVTTNEDTTYTFTTSNFTDGFSDVDGDSLAKVKITTLPSNGTLKLNGNAIALNDEINATDLNSTTYEPNLNYHGADSFSGEGYDGTSWSDATIMNITVASINDIPTFTSNATATVNENQTSAIDLNATDADSDTLSYSISGTDASSFDIDSSTGVVTFKTAPDHENKSSYTFTANVSDGNGGSDTQDVSISVSDIADVVPSLSNFTASIDEDISIGAEVGSITVSHSGDSAITEFTLSDTTNFEVNASGTITTKTTLDYETTTSYDLNITATNSAGQSSSASVTITIHDINEAPQATFTEFTTNEDTAHNGTLTATDADADSITFIKVSDPSNGSLSLESNGAFTYTPTANYYGSDSFSYRANDSELNSTTQTVSVTVNGQNDTPTIDTTFDDITLLENNGTTNYEINVSDIEGDALTLTVESNDTSIITTTPNWTNTINQATYSTALDFNLTTVADAFGVVKITINLSDVSGETDTTSFDVNITEVADIFQSGDTWKGLVYETVTSPHTGKVWLDRNLGATQVCTAYNDTACYGDYYQWGRDADGHEKSTSSTTSTQATDVANAGTDFITYNDDWAEAADSDGSLRSANWSKTDGSSLCPAGYRVPTIEELIAETIDISGFDNRDDAFASFLKLPSAGYRSYDDGTMGGQGSSGYVWPSSPTGGSKANSVIFSSSYAIWTSDYRAYGQSVRCIKD